MIIKISTWNVNGVRARIDVLTSWLKNNQPDILCLQETKCVNEEFPKDHFESMGYIVYLNGQKSFNGVGRRIFSLFAHRSSRSAPATAVSLAPLAPMPRPRPGASSVHPPGAARRPAARRRGLIAAAPLNAPIPLRRLLGGGAA